MNQELLKKKQAISYFLNKGLLVSTDILDLFSNDINLDSLYATLQEKVGSKAPIIFSKDINATLSMEQIPEINWPDLEKAKAMFERGKGSDYYATFIKYLKEAASRTNPPERVRVVSSFEEDSKKREVQDFVSYFNARYKALANIIMARPEFKSTTTISRALQKKARESVWVIGMVSTKKMTKNNNLILTIEDQTGSTKVLISKNKPDVFNKARSIVLDEVIGLAGTSGEGIIFANEVIWPDIMQNKIKKSEEEAYALFLSDLHVGSNNFLSAEFDKFLKWINLEVGNDSQREIAQKAKYIFILGDLVDGCGVYPGQENELVVKDITEQYNEVAKLLSKIPKHIHLIICPGNHDSLRLAEPQPALYRDFAAKMYELPNATLVSNPSLVNIHSSETFPGFDVLLYHGYSFDYYVANVDEIREKGGYDRADVVMRFLLERRHLAPTHTSTLYIPTKDNDPLVIPKTPDFFATGHIHKSSVSHYKHITLICGSCWQSKTAFQEKVGHNPEPGRIPAVNLKTREVKILKFL